MKKKLSLLYAVLLLLSLSHMPAHAINSAERTGGNAQINSDGVPLLEFPTASIEAVAAADGNGGAAAALSTEQFLAAVETVNSGGAVRIAVTAAAGAEDAGTVSAAMPREALEAVAEQTDAELELIADVGQITMSHEAIAAIAAEADSGDVTFRMTRKAADSGEELLGEKNIQTASVTEVDILSGGSKIPSWDGGKVLLNLPADADGFEQGKGYRVVQLSDDGVRTEHTGRCVAGAEGLCIETTITHLGTFAVLSGAVAENMGVVPAAIVMSPLATGIDGGSGSGTAYIWFAAAGLILVAGAAAGIGIKRRRQA